jgi:hypothetical protein
MPTLNFGPLYPHGYFASLHSRISNATVSYFMTHRENKRAAAAARNAYVTSRRAMELKMHDA